VRKDPCPLRHIALTIAGSDSSAAAGVQGDLKTFSALGVYACTVIAAITAQNTREIRNVTPIEADSVSSQISSIIRDIPPTAIKVGMIHNSSAIKAAAKALGTTKCPIVLDPVMHATNKAKLMEEDAIPSLLSTLAPISHVITPNIVEAEKISGQRIKNYDDISSAAKRIQTLGVRNVIIKGGHADSKLSTDYLLQQDGEAVRISRNRILTKDIHGAGCNFSAALTAFIARKFSLRDSFELANEYIHKAIQNVYKIGKGLPIIDPIFSVYIDSCRFNVLRRIQEAIDCMESIENLGLLLPETQSNIVFALEGAKKVDDVAAVKGRIVRIGNRARPSTHAQFGSSYHTANAVLAYHAINGRVRSAMNIKFDYQIKSICSSRFTVSNYQRSKEPKRVKSQDGRSISWGITEALRNNPNADIIYHTGDFGKEAMTMVFGYDPFDVLNKLKIILREYQ
jgi:hydroxymethylpyrimidine kinase / phosphomethylpyrimidine kinase / thiamine-phosphate diphosphorylase